MLDELVKKVESLLEGAKKAEDFYEEVGCYLTAREYYLRSEAIRKNTSKEAADTLNAWLTAWRFYKMGVALKEIADGLPKAAKGDRHYFYSRALEMFANAYNTAPKSLLKKRAKTYLDITQGLVYNE